MQDFDLKIIASPLSLKATGFPVVQSQAAKNDIVKTTLDQIQHEFETCRRFAGGDIRDLLLPWTLFGVAHALSAPLLGVVEEAPTISILLRIPLAAIFIIANLLPGCISNQRHPAAIQEDKINKPYRPVASGRVTPQRAAKMHTITNIVACLISYQIGGLLPCISLVTWTYLYNDLGGADKSWVLRHLLNGLGFVSFGMGAMEAAIPKDLDIRYSSTINTWLLILVLVIFTGIQSMDIYDVEGDALIGRRTLPLLVGDFATRWSIIFSMVFWSAFCPWYWGLGFMGYVIPVIGAAWISARYLTKKDPKADKRSYILWNLWMLSIYTLPLVKTCCL